MKTEEKLYLSIEPEVVTTRSFWFYDGPRINRIVKDCSKPLTLKEKTVCFIDKYCPTFMDWYWQLSHPNLPHNKLTK